MFKSKGELKGDMQMCNLKDDLQICRARVWDGGGGRTQDLVAAMDVQFMHLRRLRWSATTQYGFP